MKKVYSMLSRAFIFGLVLTIPLIFFAQEEEVVIKEGEKDTEIDVKKKEIGFSPFWYVQGEIGPSWSHADFSRYNLFPDLSHTNINGAVGFGRQWTKVWSTYINLERGFFDGEKQNVYTKNLPSKNPVDGTFTNDYYGGSFNVGVNLSNWWGGYKDRLVTFGIHAGVGQAQWKAQLRDLNTDAFITSYGYSTSIANNQGGGINDRKVAITVPAGININFNINDRWDIYGDYVYTWMDTDNADGGTHGEMQVFNDVHSHFNIGARIKFGGNKVKKMADNFDEVQLVVTPDPLEEVGDSVEVTIKGTFPPKYFDKNAVVCFTPVLEYEGGETEFESMNFIGENVEGDGVMISHANGGSFSYTEKVPYNPAMDVSELTVAPVFYKYNGEVYDDCGDAATSGKAYIADRRKTADGVIHTSKYIRHNEMVGIAPHGYELETISTQEAEIFFQVNRSNLNMGLPLNKNTGNTDNRDNVIGDMEQGWAVKNIVIDGWASPEGEETFNQGLSEKRASTTAKYLEKRITKAAKKNDMMESDLFEGIEVIESANGPDWNGFMKAVEASGISDKNAILNVINSAPAAADKEAEIRNMILIYPELERDILPPLRGAIIGVNTYEPKRTAEEIANLSTSDPSQLSMAELFYAATLTDDNGTQRVIYASIMEQYPKCYRGYNNAAAIELEEGNVEEAKALIDQAAAIKGDSYQVWNNLGVYYAMVGDYNNAKNSFNKSQELGGDVNYNMGLVNIYYGNYAAAVSNLSSYNCDFNFGLAQMLNGDNNGAKNTFDCVDPQDAEANYIQAILGARSDDKSMMLEYLGKAFKQVPELKKTATFDREFIKYYSDPDFKALVGMME